MYCPTCRTEYRHGFTRCSDCDSALVDQLPAESASATEDGELPNAELVTVEVFHDHIDAEIAKGALEAAGIEAMLQSDDARGTQPSLSMSRGVELLVRAEDAEKADEVLNGEPLAEDSDVPGETEA